MLCWLLGHKPLSINDPLITLCYDNLKCNVHICKRCGLLYTSDLRIKEWNWK